MQLDQMLDLAGHHAEMVLLQLQMPALMPIFMFEAGGQCGFIQAHWRNDQEKLKAAGAAREIMQQHGATKYSLVCEVWRRSRPGAHEEELVLAFATDGMETRWRVWAIARDRSGQVAALTLDDEPPPENTHSYLTNLLGGTA